VAGAPTGSGLGDGLGEGDADASGECAADSDGVGLSAAPAPSLAELLGLGETLPPGENEGGVRDPPPEHAETDTEASMVMVPQPSMASLALSPVPVMAGRTLIKPPRKATAIPVKAVDGTGKL
jgi:hypothetical protein